MLTGGERNESFTPITNNDDLSSEMDKMNAESEFVLLQTDLKSGQNQTWLLD